MLSPNSNSHFTASQWAGPVYCVVPFFPNFYMDTKAVYTGWIHFERDSAHCCCIAFAFRWPRSLTSLSLSVDSDGLSEVEASYSYRRYILGIDVIYLCTSSGAFPLQKAKTKANGMNTKPGVPVVRLIVFYRKTHVLRRRSKYKNERTFKTSVGIW